MNVLLLLAEYRLHYIQVSFKTVVYSIKLKLEVSVLNRFQSLMLGRLSLRQYEPDEQRQSSNENLVDKSLVRSDVAPEVTLQPVVAQTEIPHLSLRPSCIHGYHGALREPSSKDITSLGDASPSQTLSESHPSTNPTGSSETLPALDLSLSRFSCKFDV